MSPMLVLSLALLSQGPAPAPRDVSRSFEFGGQKRSYHVHLPTGYDARKATPLVVVLHGAGTDGKIMEQFCGMSEEADRSGFIACYPNGTGFAPFLTWNAGSFPYAAPDVKKPDDIGYLKKVLDDVAGVANVDPKRVYVVGMSNGGMMAYRAAAEMSDRFAAMASVTGTIVTESWAPKHPMPVLEIHGTKDTLVPFEGTKKKNKFLAFPPIEEVVQICAKANGIEREPTITRILPSRDDMKVEKRDYGKGKNGAEVVLYVLEGGGHVWPGQPVPAILGRNTFNLDACETIWEFVSRFKRE
jgi:polyhydroxybutyrate depolymerase